MDIMSIFKEQANELLMKFGISKEVERAKEGFGDFTLPCFFLAKKYRKNPAEIARDIANKIEKNEYFDKIEAVGPYLNFHINQKKLSEIVLKNTLDEKIFQFDKKGKVVVEHTSANPTGPLHVGRARNPIIGDTMARILKEYGFEVETQYFVNDAGLQVATLLWGIKNLRNENEQENDTKCDHKLVRYYQRASKMAKEDKIVEKEIRETMKNYEAGEPELRELAKKEIGCVLSGISETLRRINVEIDKYVWESTLIPHTREIVSKLKEYLSEENGAYYIDFKKLNVKLQKDKFYLYRQDGTTLYFLRDIAYHLEKAKKTKKIIDVMGEDHKLHFNALREVLKLLDPAIDMKALFYSFVSLPDGKMSTRRGNAVYLDDLIDEGFKKAMEIIKDRGYDTNEENNIAMAVATSAIRYSILNVQEEKKIVFKWDRALSFDGESAPFIMYTYARAISILSKTEWCGEYNHEKLTHPNEIKLLKLLAEYPTVVRESVEKLSPYIMAKYAYSLATQFNQFYRDCPVLSSDLNTKNARIALVKAFTKVMEHVMNNLGISRLQKM